MDKKTSAKRAESKKVGKVPDKRISRVSKRSTGHSKLARRAMVAAGHEAADRFLASLAEELAI